MMVTGRTRLYAIIGDPIVQVRSPQTFTQRFHEAGFDALRFPVHVPASRFDAIVPALAGIANLDGIIATVPFKARALALADRVGEAAGCIGAVNALRREADGSWSGEMFDGTGFVRGAQAKGARLDGRRVALFGAGGAGSAIAHALAVAGAESIAIIDPLADRAAALCERLRAAVPACRFTTPSTLSDDVDMIVNASPIGMRPGDGMPAAIGPLSRDMVVGDVVITDTPTPLVRHAMSSGCEWVDGRAMLAGQVDAIVAFFEPNLRALARQVGHAHEQADGARSR